MRAGHQVNVNWIFGEVDKRTMQVKCAVSMQRNGYSVKVRFR
jgi:hypothetical protein